MARLLGPDKTSRYLGSLTATGPYEYSSRLTTVYSDAAGTTLADIATYDGTVTPGAVIAGSQVTLTAQSQLPQFWFPADGSDTLWVRPAGGPLIQITADNDARLDAVESAGGLGAKLPLPRPKILTNVTYFQSGHGWTAGNTLSNNLNDTSVFALGTQSAGITTKTDGTAATLTTPGGFSLDMSTSKQLRLLVRVDGVDNLSGLTVYATSDNFTGFGIMKIQNHTPDAAVRWLKEGEWRWVTCNWSDAVITGITGSVNLAAINALRVRATPLNGVSFTVRVNAVQVVERKDFGAGGIVCWTYDDSYRAQYTIAKPRLDLYGMAATAYTIPGNVTQGEAGNTTWLTTAQLQEMHDWSNWEVCPHAWNVTNHARAVAGAGNPLSAAELDLDLRQTRQWLVDRDLNDGYNGYCYPQGKFTTTVVKQLANGRSAYARAMTSTATAPETLPPADPYAIRCRTLDNGTVLATEQAVVDATAAHGGLLVYCAHDIVTSASTSTQVSTAIHNGLVDYVAGKAGLRVMTLGDVMRGLAAQG